jgi:uncharacterized protein (DUF2461 family)
LLAKLKALYDKLVFYFSDDEKMKRLNAKLEVLNKKEVLADLQNKVDAKRQKIAESSIRGIFK